MLDASLIAEVSPSNMENSRYRLAMHQPAPGVIQVLLRAGRQVLYDLRTRNDLTAFCIANALASSPDPEQTARKMSEPWNTDEVTGVVNLDVKFPRRLAG